MSKVLIIPVFIPHYGCHHHCIFCNQRQIAGDYTIPDETELCQLVQDYRQSCQDIDQREVQLAFYGGSFTGLEVSMQEKLLASANYLKRNHLIQKIRLSTRPDYIDDAILNRLAWYSVDIIELGVQSLQEDVLLSSQRGHTARDVMEAVQLIRQKECFQLGLQLMVALPGDTPKKSLDSAFKVADMSPDFVRIYPTAVIKDTPLATLWENGEYVPWPMDTLLDCAAQMLDIFWQRQIPVIRIGLQATDQLQEEGNILAGAFHPAMGELVKSRLFRQRLEQCFEREQAATYIIHCAPGDASQIIGQHQCNLRYFEKKQMHLMIKPEGHMIRGDFHVESF